MKATLPMCVLALAVAWSATAKPAPVHPQNNSTPTAGEIRALVERIRVNQHHNDDALAEYERRERRIARKDDARETITDDKLFRVVPTGTGTLKLLLEEKGKAVSDEFYAKELRELERVLVNALNPAESKQHRAVEKWESRSRERQEMVDAVPDAFLFTWMGRETLNGRTLAKLQLDPNPEFKPHSRNADLFEHIRATVWVEESEAQIVRVEARIIKDISVFGGVFGKIYHGGAFVMEQTKVAEGVWLPTRYEYDFDGRKFIFPFSVNETTVATQYRHIGPPDKALVAVRREIQNGSRRNGSKPASGSSK